MSNFEEVAQATMHVDSGETWQLTYLLQAIDTQEGIAYGLVIHKQHPAGTLAESADTGAFTPERDTALRMAHAFAAGTVPPGVLLEMADDWLCTAG